MNMCARCSEDFGGVRLFDRHRVGVHGYTELEGLPMDPPREDGRRCLAVDEMAERGWCRSGRGRWVDPVEVARGVCALHRSAGGVL
jgi:hypothetical protein